MSVRPNLLSTNKPLVCPRLRTAGPAIVFLAFFLGFADSPAAEFPSPRMLTLPAPGLSVTAVRFAGDAVDDILVGMAGGVLGLVHYTATSTAFELRQQLVIGGQPVDLLLWEGLPIDQRGVVVATTNPDRVHFVSVRKSFPHLAVEATVELDEDPGTLAWFGNVPGGFGQVAVSLPGIDAVAFLADDAGWRVRQVLPVGDQPYALVSVDFDGDLVREVVAAERGYLSGDLAVLRLGVDGQASAQMTAFAGVVAGQVVAWDEDQSGTSELAVADRDGQRIVFLRAEGGILVESGRVDLVLPAQSLVTWRLDDGSPALAATNVDRGVTEFLSRQSGVWVRHAAYYPGCRPVRCAPADLDGDGRPDLVSVGADGNILSVMLASQKVGFWAFPLLVLGAVPGDFILADFSDDGTPDLLVAAAGAARLTLFAGKPAGGFEATGADQALAYYPGKMALVNADDDPAPEVAVLDVIAGGVVILDYLAGVGFVEKSRWEAGNFPGFITSGDIDNDGFADLLVLPSTPGQVLLLFGAADGGFQERLTLTYAIPSVQAALVDLNGDRRLDVVAVDGLSRVWWMVNQTGRAFGTGQWLHAGNGASSLATGDVDGDGDDDAAVGCRVDRSLVFLENNGAGQLVRRAGALVMEVEPAGVAMGDFDQDGRSDVAVNLKSAARLDILLSVVPWRTDLVLRVPSTSDVLAIEVADLNADGTNDVMAFDSSLWLGISVLNVDPRLVAIEPQRVSAECVSGHLQVRVRPDPPGTWRLEVRSGERWLLLAAEGRAYVGQIERDGSAWVLIVDEAVTAAWAADAVLRLIVDEGVGEETSLVPLPVGCASSEFGRHRLAWADEPHPNPFNPSVSAAYHAGTAGRAVVSVHDLAGRRVARLADGTVAAGTHVVSWNGDGDHGPASAGTYLLRVEMVGGVISRKILLLK